MNKKNYTTIPVEQQKTTSLEVNEKGSLLSDLVGDDGLIQAELDQEVVDEILSTSIYNRPEVAIREVFNNSLRQCRTALKAGAKPIINIIFDVKRNRLVFEEIDSMGMPVQIFKDVYRHTGRSGNMDGNESGQFGIGKKSFRAIADTMIFETWARATNEKYAFITKGSKFEELPEPNLQTFGTRVSFAIKESVSMVKLAQYVQNIAKFTQIKTYLIFTENLHEQEDPEYRKYGESFSKGSTKIGPVDKKEFLVKQLETEAKFIEWIEIETPDYSLLGAFDAHSRREQLKFENLVGIPISLGQIDDQYGTKKDNEWIEPGFDGYILDVKNERKYPPVASRDYLKQDSFENLKEVIKKDLEEFFSKIQIKTLADYRASSQQYYVNNRYFGELTDSMPSDTRNFQILLEISDADSFYLKDGKVEESNLYRHGMKELILKNCDVVYNYNRSKKRIQCVLNAKPETIVIVPRGDRDNRLNKMAIMSRAEIPDLKEYMKQNNIKSPKREILGEVSVRMCSYSNTVEHMDIDDLNEFCIRVPKEKLEESNISEFVRSVTSYEYKQYGFLRDQKKLEDSESITLEEFLSKNKKAQFVTSKGTLTGKQIMKKSLIAVIRPAKSKYSDLLTFEFVKSKLKDTLIILDEEETDENNKVSSFLLAYKVENQEHDFNVIEDHFDSSIASWMVTPLNLEGLEGAWKNEPRAALFYLGEIKNPEIRELYARAYSKIYEYNHEGWESDKPEDVAEHNALHKIFAEMEKNTSTHTMLEQAQKFLESKEFEECDFSDKLKEFFEELLNQEIQKIEDIQERAFTAAQICLKDKICENSLSLRIGEKDYAPEIVMSFEIEQKTTITKDLFELITKNLEGYYQLDSISIEGNRIEVVLD